MEVPTPTVEGLTATGESKTHSGPAALFKPISFTAHTRSVYSVAFSPDGKYVLTGSYDRTAKLWDTE